jgi:hypothetical protein
MPQPADVQTRNGGKRGKAERGDSITFTFAGAVNPLLVLAGWDGSATSATVHIQNPGKKDILTVRNSSTGTQLAALGSVQLNANYSDNVDFRGSTMTLSGNTITIVLGSQTGAVKDNAKPATMVWTTPNGSATESGALDSEF